MQKVTTLWNLYTLAQADDRYNKILIEYARSVGASNQYQIEVLGEIEASKAHLNGIADIQGEKEIIDDVNFMIGEVDD